MLFATEPSHSAGDSPDPSAWKQAQAALVLPLTEAAGALGRLDAMLAAMDAAAAAGITRLTLTEAEAMLWAGGIVLPREDIARDARDGRAASDPEAMRLARRALRRLEGQGALTDLPAFLGLHRPGGTKPGGAARLRGPDFERGAAHYLARAVAADLHPLVRGCRALLLWRQAKLPPPSRVIEPATHSARLMAQGFERLLFARPGLPC